MNTQQNQINEAIKELKEEIAALAAELAFNAKQIEGQWTDVVAIDESQRLCGEIKAAYSTLVTLESLSSQA